MPSLCVVTCSLRMSSIEPSRSVAESAVHSVEPREVDGGKSSDERKGHAAFTDTVLWLV